MELQICDASERHIPQIEALERVCFSVPWTEGMLAGEVAEAVQIRFSYAFGISRLIPEQEIHNNALTVGLGLLF